MKKALMSSLAIALLFSACKEPFSYTPPIDTSSIVDSSYRVGGISDINTKKVFEYQQPITIAHLNGTPKKVAMSVTGLPPNASATFTPPQGLAPFVSTLSLKTENAPVGIYAVTIEAKAEGFAPQKFPINLHIDTFTRTECNQYFFKVVGSNPLGDLTTYDLNNLILSKSSTITLDQISGKLYIKNMFLNYISPATGDNYFSTQDVAITVDCNQNKIEVPYQVVYGKASNGGSSYFIVSGTGSIDIANGQYIINYKSDNNFYTIKGSYKL